MIHTFVVTVDTPRPVATAVAILSAVWDNGGTVLEKVPWAPDPDTIADAVGQPVEVVDLNDTGQI